MKRMIGGNLRFRWRPWRPKMLWGKPHLYNTCAWEARICFAPFKASKSKVNEHPMVNSEMSSVQHAYDRHAYFNIAADGGTNIEDIQPPLIHSANWSYSAKGRAISRIGSVCCMSNCLLLQQWLHTWCNVSPEVHFDWCHTARCIGPCSGDRVIIRCLLSASWQWSKQELNSLQRRHLDYEQVETTG